MKNVILILILSFAGIQIQAQQMPLPDPNTSNVLFLKFSQNETLNGENSFSSILRVLSADGVNYEKQNSYLFYSNDSRGRAMDYQFYTPNKNYFGYTEVTPYNSVALTKDQLKDVLNTKERHLRTQYMKSFSKIYIIDLDAPSPTQPTKYKIIEVKLYFE